eukprot:1427131-Rhodomonas_salina.1
MTSKAEKGDSHVLDIPDALPESLRCSRSICCVSCVCDASCRTHPQLRFSPSQLYPPPGGFNTSLTVGRFWRPLDPTVMPEPAHIRPWLTVSLPHAQRQPPAEATAEPSAELSCASQSHASTITPRAKHPHPPPQARSRSEATRQPPSPSRRRKQQQPSPPSASSTSESSSLRNPVRTLVHLETQRLPSLKCPATCRACGPPRARSGSGADPSAHSAGSADASPGSSSPEPRTKSAPSSSRQTPCHSHQRHQRTALDRVAVSSVAFSKS